MYRDHEPIPLSAISSHRPTIPPLPACRAEAVRRRAGEGRGEGEPFDRKHPSDHGGKTIQIHPAQPLTECPEGALEISQGSSTSSASATTPGRTTQHSAANCEAARQRESIMRRISQTSPRIHGESRPPKLDAYRGREPGRDLQADSTSDAKGTPKRPRQSRDRAPIAVHEKPRRFIGWENRSPKEIRTTK